MVTNIKDLKTKDGELSQLKIDNLRIDKPILSEVASGKFKEFSIKINRDAYNIFPDRLPTMGILPLPIDEHEHIGMYESKQTLYLTIANAYNKAMEKIELLEKEIEKLKGL